MKLSDIYIRDPYILAADGIYYLYGTMGKYSWNGGCGFDVYTSRDLVEWEGPYEVFRPDEDFWADKNFWAPEVHRYKNRYYMLASFYHDNEMRGTQVLVSDTPTGPFRTVSERPQTPAEWMCLDGTLYIDREDKPWMVFCHEWTQITDGAVCAIRLSDDLSRSVGEPVTLFHASQSGWSRCNGDSGSYVTDGPFMYRKEDGELLLLWSSFGNGYSVGTAHSSNGDITGEWRNDEKPFFEGNGGHCMVFRDYEGGLRLALHQPDSPYGQERTKLLYINESESGITLSE